MRKYKIRASFLILLTILISQFVFPIIGLSLNNSNDDSIDRILIDPFDFSKSTRNSQLKTSELTYAVFDSSLNNYYSKLDSESLDANKYIDVIILFKEGIIKSERIDILKKYLEDFNLKSNYDIISGISVRVNALELQQKVNFLSTEKTIEKIYKTKVFQNSVIFDDSLRLSQEDASNYENWWVETVGADNIAYDGSGVRVAVMDSGIYNHPDLNIVDQASYVTIGGGLGDLNGHGTHVAGIVGSNGASSGGKYRGIAPGVSLIDAQAGNSSGSLIEDDIIDAIQWASNPAQGNADIISMSFGGGDPVASDPITTAITAARDNYNVTFVASAGNSGSDYYTGSTPATGIDVISVGATEKDDKLASFSSRGPTYSYIGYPDVVAPGVNIISTEAPNSIISKQERFKNNYFDFSGNGDYMPLSGTSMSCPVVSGAIAILMQAYPKITPETARIALLKGAERLPNDRDAGYTDSGAGLINVSASLDFLDLINSTNSDINNITTTSPSFLPIEPFDLLSFPGDIQEFNISVISGRQNTVNLALPTIDGISLSQDTSSLVFTRGGVKFNSIKIGINKDAKPGLRNFFINLTINGEVKDQINVSVNVKLPEHRILMESFHGLNDWMEGITTFPQIGFYEAMKDIQSFNISIDYGMEYWKRGYDKDVNNSILTGERLSQYDAILLQNPLLPYSPYEINNLKNYFMNGGNIFFLGTRYQELCMENVNALFTNLGVDTLINEENILLSNYVGIGAIVTSLSALPVNNHPIFDGVGKFQWTYGSTFNATGDAVSIAELGGRSVAVAYNTTNPDEGKFVAFGDLYWMYSDYQSSSYTQDHRNLLENIFEYLFDDDEVSLSIDLGPERTNDANLDLYIYAMNNTSGTPILNSTLATNMSVSISNGGSTDKIILKSKTHGTAFNDTYSLLWGTSTDPYIVDVNLTIGSTLYRTSSKVLFYDLSSIPIINSLSSNPTSQSRGNSVEIIANMDSTGYSDFKSYISLYSGSFFNSYNTLNETIELDNEFPSLNNYDKQLNLLSTYPSGAGVFYVIPQNSGYINPNSQREYFTITNSDPTLSDTLSFFQIGDSSETQFSSTTEDDSIIPQFATQDDIISFRVSVNDAEDLDANLNVSVNLFMGTLSEPNIEGTSTISLIIPSQYVVSILNYDGTSHSGALKIPRTMLYSTIAGNKEVSTSANLQQQDDYIGILYINVLDSEGNSIDDPFFIALSISAAFEWMPFIIILVVIGAIVGVGALVYAIRRKRISGDSERTSGDYEGSSDQGWQGYDTESSSSSSNSDSPIDVDGLYYCPFCGQKLDNLNRYCPNCGKSLSFD